ncbi:M3 family metallopeptidase [Paraglaciecola sp. L3A3]|uniref:M3 family metallopeptidase n=1 Tax=Paraglaciecola sp. L3A3 TaxID=2686358 RepID=UPI00131C6FB5|nr:M3 family metallopeptidase [Paraglaciecola sp. L3A3]
MKLFRSSYSALFCSAFVFLFAPVAVAENTFQRSPEVISENCTSYMATFNQQLSTLVSDPSAATYDSVFQSFDDYMTEFVDEFLHDYLMQNVHTDQAIRKASTDCALKGMALLNELAMNRDLYDRMSAVKTQGLSADKIFTVNYWKQQFESSGIGKPKQVREQIKEVNDDISEIGNTFNQNITKAVESISVNPNRLAGLPQDYLDSHPVDENGLVVITTAYSDITPIEKYAHDASLRKEVAIMKRNRAVAENQPVLMQLLEKRYQLAKLLGHKNFAETNLLGTMVSQPSKVVQFTDKLSAAIKAPVLTEKAMLLAQKQKLTPSTKQVFSWDEAYLSNIIREQYYKLDTKLVREYFDYDKVRDGIIALSEDLFDITIKRSNMASWHTSVEAYEVYENKKLIGNFYLDSHPREGKYTHAAQFGVRLGKKDKTTPAAALVMNFPKGLMEHAQVETFLHEYGHLLHFIFAGQNDIGYSRFQGESDFNEAPSMMLQEWVWNYQTLKRFATNSKGQVIPKALVEKMNEARYLGQALGVATQLTYTAMSFDLYNRDPKDLDLNTFEQDIFNRYSPYGYVDGTYLHTSFGHLNSYGAKYYTYQWSNSIAEELLSRFKKEGLRNKKTANDYRQLILAKTGTKPAAELVKDFLGRDFTVEAYAQKLSKGE